MLWLNVFRLIIAGIGLWMALYGTIKREKGVMLTGQIFGIAVLVSFAFTGIA